MDFYAIARQMKSELLEYIRQRLATIVNLVAYSTSTANGEHDKVRGFKTEGAGEQSYDLDGRRIFPFGIRSCPPRGVFGVWIGCGDSGVIVGAESSRFGPSDLEDGEVAIYCKVDGAILKLDKNGAAALLAAAGQVASIGGDTFKMLRWDDGATGGLVVPLLAFLTALHGATDTAVNAAADAFKSAIQTASNFSSTTAKNG